MSLPPPSWIPDAHVQTGKKSKSYGNIVMVACEKCKHSMCIIDTGQKIPCPACKKTDNMCRVINDT
jgi:hypothetical protein